MAKIKTISDKLAKRKCAEWLERNGFNNVELAKNSSCDLIGEKDDQKYFIEVKYSSKDNGKFFGTVMLTEMFKAISNKNNYLFLVCRGNDENINTWFFKLFTVQTFIKCCTLTTPIFLYHLYSDEKGNLTIPKFRNDTKLASEKLIKEMWKDFKKWKIKS
ncbi:MAG: hypothetical protein UW39_C0022G0014 [Parcubacteria group bacterium GW2011_GWC2_44_17]|uniref:Uncharacterized protein n=1 Tax=Candidatus Jacksonbacteria bacterium RIFCSPLOWO2_02_FULL_44_20 TaxID=1798460 RepID=A0A1G2ABU9_9BACT|nr:MAG: hypothetical protein UW39_C0022G0014 [Parcubacteria group bacterium GW2011_GWC2_44_17]KKT50434.1 MAG: hypothetical protein UW40_C0004G0024 [Parcubacteria group bacterium GW2011_GWF2_44_17]OGY72162.1 MAG: hypothetical protein A3E05_04600 [Candidatus Jacksonbacteria bacterium RIFCSPHIGHO2_12_FULL_44_12]OGY73520.1 MAG: hypothetical protein A3H61_03180 [Candidatus Jacksonbacteria bacterium RIFCSPLOWO2_02_FULL_44_20]OGY74380.1 MAG: hypothetical protein A3H07_04155 [Candidatus Jacksonbacteria